MKTKHTPGPWGTSRDAVPEGYVQITVYAEATGRRVATAFEDAGNAPLIAAAPELLAQLNAFVEFANEWFTKGMPEDWRGRCVCANAAIDKATGN